MTSLLTKLLPYKRPILAAVAALTVVAIVRTMAPVVPRSVAIVARVGAPELRERPSSLVISTEGHTVIEAQAAPSAVRNGVLEYSFDLAPGPHRLEFRVDGCRATTRTFDPGEQDLVAFEYRCEPGERDGDR
jgi:hypothetical protein